MKFLVQTILCHNCLQTHRGHKGLSEISRLSVPRSIKVLAFFENAYIRGDRVHRGI